jgi:hypothetical protein
MKNIDNFSIIELLNLLNLKIPVSRSEIISGYNETIKKYSKPNTLKLFENAKKKIIDYLDKNKLETIFSEEYTLLEDKNVIQREFGYENTDDVVLHSMNPLKRRIQKKTIVIHTKDRQLYVTTKCKNRDANDGIVDKFLEDEDGSLTLHPDIINSDQLKGKVNGLTPDENNELIVSHNIPSIPENELYANFVTSNTSTLHTIPSFNLKNCQKKYNNNLERCVEGKINTEYNSTYLDVFDDSGNPLKKYCGNTNNNFIKNKRIENTLNFEEFTQIDDEKRQYKENASNFLYDFNFTFNNIIKTTLITICIKKNIINLFAPGKNYYMTVKLYDKGDPNGTYVDIDISVCTSLGNDSLEDVLDQINSQLHNSDYISTDWFEVVNEEDKTYKLTIDINTFNAVKFLNKTCSYTTSLAHKLDILHTEIYDGANPQNKTIKFPDFLYFLYDDLTNNYHTSYYASTRESSLSSSVLAYVPLDGDFYKLDNRGSDLDVYSREYFGKVNIEKARFQLLSPDGDLVNIDQTHFVNNNYYFKLAAECVYDI